MDGNIPGLRHSLSGQFVLDLSNSPISYINNLESDSAYAHWSASLHTLFTLDFSGGIRRIRKNLYNVILVIDPASSESREMLRLTESFLLHMTAIRLVDDIRVVVVVIACFPIYFSSHSCLVTGNRFFNASSHEACLMSDCPE
ncbi:unnamed protein product [Trichobilharzia regenti]|nr:unnamed protein product [Trichobilharzia regenti]